MKITGLFFKQNPIKQFNYIPRYYNERKEQLKELADKRKGKLIDDKAYFEGFRRTNYRSNWRLRTEYTNTQNKKTKIRLIVIFSVLLIIAYLVVKLYVKII